MKWKANYYGIRGRLGYLHAACLGDFLQANARYDAQGRLVWKPEIACMIDDLGHAKAGNCLHCKTPLDRASSQATGD